MSDTRKLGNISKILRSKYLRNILILSIIVGITLPLGNILFIYPSFSKMLIDNTEEEAERVAKHLMDEIFPEKTEISRYSITTDVTDNVQKILEHFHLVKLKIFSTSGEIIYSTNPNDIGKINTKSYFHNTVAKGESFSKVVKKNTMSLEDQKMTVHVVETYVPIIENNNFIGAFEIYYNITNRTERLGKLLSSTTAVLFSLAIVLTGSIILLLKNAAKNISQREKAEGKLKIAKKAAEAANNAKSEFLANMSHELRTPLNHIIGFTELIVDKQFGPLNDAQTEYLNDVLAGSRHLLSLINDILDLSKVEAGKLELEISKVEAKVLLEKSLFMVKEKAMKTGLQLSLDINDIPETITADERKLKQIIYNLLSNAVKFTPNGGQISVSARKVVHPVDSKRRIEGADRFQISDNDTSKDKNSANASQSCLEVSISDTGIGIKPEDQVCIFKPFEQIRDEKNLNQQGTGLGLTLTKELVELHGGRIWVESECKEKGCTFTFVIPI